MKTRTFWLSFADDDGFRGVCIVDVDQEEAEAQRARLDRDFPKHGPEAEWLAAALVKAHDMACNPGGDVLANEVGPDTPGPRLRLMQEPELRQRGLIGP